MSFHEISLNRRTFSLGATVGLAGTTVIGSRAFAQEATPATEEQGGVPPLPDGAVVVAQGLWNPGDIAFGADGTLYVAEQGVSVTPEGDAAPATPAATPVSDVPQAGLQILVWPQITQVAPDGTVSVLTSEIGGVGIGVYDSTVYVSIGGSSVGGGLTPLPEENTVWAVDATTGAATQIAALGTYEVENNPDGTDVNPNLYGLAVDANGLVYVADAGGNTIYTIDPATGEFSLFAVVPNLTDLTGATPTAEEEAVQPGPRQPVPTAIVIDEGGYINAVLLGEAWSGPSIIAFAPDGTYTTGISGLSMIVNAALGPDGLLYVSQLTSDIATMAPGSIQRITADGTVETVIDGLLFPHGIAFDAEGNLFVTTNSIISGPDAPLGLLLRFDGIATPA